MHVDITRDTFDPARHFSRVLMQQGRVPLDADLNEQSSILLHYLRTLTADLLGPHAGPGGNGFKVGYTTQNGGTIAVGGPGRYYVNGLLCEIEGDQSIPASQATRGGRSDAAAADGGAPPPLTYPFIVFMEVWEQLVTAYHQPLLRETALGGPDTAARTQVMWRIRAEQLQAGQGTCAAAWPAVLGGLGVAADRNGLQVRAGGTSTDTLDPCVLPPDARYRGMENQLYRVEVHTRGDVGGATPPTFKWSRENGSVAFPIRSLSGVEVEVETLGLDPRLDLAPGDWVEILDDQRAGRGMLARVADVDRDGLRVTLEDTDDDYPEYSEKHAVIHPLLRRWDQSDPVVLRGNDGTSATKGTLRDGAVEAVDAWIELEAGIIVRFQPNKRYLEGDYWLIPARVATGDVEWPRAANGTDPAVVPARRPERFYAPLGVVTAENTVNDCRRTINKLVTP
ncbi:MAG TPA: DUF6519 domain-containing protein [Longimicrobium sp.]